MGSPDRHYLRGNSSHTIAIRGEGVASYCCAHLLSKAGFKVVLERVDRPRLPVVMLGDQALALIRDVFDKPTQFHDAPRIKRRIVSWENSKPVAVEHSAVAVSEEMLLDGIRPVWGPEGESEAQFRVIVARPLPGESVEHRFGSRSGSTVGVTLKETSEQGACWIESLESGWLFLISPWLLAVGESAEVLLGKSKLIAPEIASVGTPSGSVPVYPRIAAPLCGSDWLACGTAAMAFDPICGDGTAHAVREAILAAAVVRAISEGGSPEDLLQHYEARLLAGFRRHLTACRSFYGFWPAELAGIERGIGWCDDRLGSAVNFKYRLQGFELRTLEAC